MLSNFNQGGGAQTFKYSDPAVSSIKRAAISADLKDQTVKLVCALPKISDQVSL